MNHTCLSGLIGVFVIKLTGCPYKETYRTIHEQPVSIQGLEVKPVTLFYSSKQNISSCDVGFRVGKYDGYGAKDTFVS